MMLIDMVPVFFSLGALSLPIGFISFTVRKMRRRTMASRQACNDELLKQRRDATARMLLIYRHEAADSSCFEVRGAG